MNTLKKFITRLNNARVSYVRSREQKAIERTGYKITCD